MTWKDNSPRIEALEPRRLLSAGDLDPTFGDNGTTTLDFSNEDVVAQGPDGKFLVMGWKGSNVAIERFTTNGLLDSTFGQNGKADTVWWDIGRLKIAFHPTDGRFAVALVQGDGTLQLAVFHADGSPDSTFGVGGYVQNISSQFLWDSIQLQAIFQSDGKIVLAAWGSNYTGDEPPPVLHAGTVVMRFNRDGGVDHGFRGGQFDDVAAEHMVQMPDGKIVFGGAYPSAISPNKDFSEIRLYRFTTAGELDATFGNSGLLTLLHLDPNAEALNGLHAFADGTLALMAHHTDNDTGNVLQLLYRISPTGMPSEPVVLALPPLDERVEFDVLPDGRMLTWGNAGDHGFVARYAPDGSLDRSYGADGFYIDAGFERSPRLLASPDGQMLLVGIHRDSNEVEVIQLARLQGGAGHPFITLNSRGTLVVNGDDAAQAMSLTLRPRDGRLVARAGDAVVRSFATTKIKRFAIFAFGGNDTITLGPGIRGGYADGGNGNDTLNGGDGNDVLLGGAGRDKLYGNDGDDKMLGGSSNDYLLGGAGKDNLFGNGGSDTLSGAGGNDRLFGGDGIDRILGGAGIDAAADDDQDTYDSVETLL